MSRPPLTPEAAAELSRLAAQLLRNDALRRDLDALSADVLDLAAPVVIEHMEALAAAGFYAQGDQTRMAVALVIGWILGFREDAVLTDEDPLRTMQDALIVAAVSAGWSHKNCEQQLALRRH